MDVDGCDNEEFQQLLAIQEGPSIRWLLRDRINPLTAFDDLEFFERFRMNKHGFVNVLEKIEPYLPSYRKKTNVPLRPVHLLSLALRYYATGDFQMTAGDCLMIHQTTVSKQLPIVTEAICRLACEVIKFPVDPSLTQRKFLDYCGLPSITGIIDGTQIPIQSHGGDNAELFRCRKGFFSYNVQIICDEK